VQPENGARSRQDLCRNCEYLRFWSYGVSLLLVSGISDSVVFPFLFPLPLARPFFVNGVRGGTSCTEILRVDQQPGLEDDDRLMDMRHRTRPGARTAQGYRR
jgi:hypothetical protein